MYSAEDTMSSASATTNLQFGQFLFLGELCNTKSSNA